MTVLSQTTPVVCPVDISNSVIATDFPGTFIKIFDNVFTTGRMRCPHITCPSLVQMASLQTPHGKRINDQVGDNDRILLFDDHLANELTCRLLPHVSELTEIKPGSTWEHIVGLPGFVTKTWKLLGVNERLSFLRYGPGHYFKPHHNGQIQLPDGRQSWVTVQIYLNDEGLTGGATWIFGKAGEDGGFYDVEPKVGRILIFEQKSFVHSGEEVVQGIKYTMRSAFLFESV